MLDTPILKNLGNIDFHFDKDFSKSVRNSATDLLTNMSFPTTRDEYWKYTRVGKWVDKEYKVGEASTANTINGELPLLEGVPKLVFINGFLSKSESDTIEGIDIVPISQAKENTPELVEKVLGQLDNRSEEVFTCINAAYHNDGYFCHVTKSIENVQIVFMNEGGVLSNPRNIVLAEPETKANIFEVHVNENGAECLTNVVNEYWIGKNAKFNVTRLIKIGAENGLISNEYAVQQEGSDFTANTFCIGGRTVRNNLNIELEGSFTETAMYGFYFNNEDGHTDNHTHVNHKMPSCNSNELYKGVLDDSATGVFNGKVNVWKDAQQTNAFQSNNNILLTDDASVNSKPELEIYADDVKCSHGSTTGRVDENALFYLRARGIDQDSAMRMMLGAFAEDTTSRITSEPLRKLISQELLKSLEA